MVFGMGWSRMDTNEKRIDTKFLTTKSTEDAQRESEPRINADGRGWFTEWVGHGWTRILEPRKNTERPI